MFSTLSSAPGTKSLTPLHFGRHAHDDTGLEELLSQPPLHLPEEVEARRHDRLATEDARELNPSRHQGLSSRWRFSAHNLLNRRFRKQFPRDYGVMIMASSRVKPGSEEYHFYQRVGRAIAETRKQGKPFFVVTGGGAGGMRAVAEGARSGGGHAVAIALPLEKHQFDVNPEFYMHKAISNRFYARGGLEDRACYAVALPGGLGTVHEIINRAFDVYYDETRRTCAKRIILVNHNNFYAPDGPFFRFLDHLIDHGYASKDIRDLFAIANTPQEVARLLSEDVPFSRTRH
ncbi:MAG: LOG family protein [Candidatus Melainabacteria bacterium]